MPRAGLTEACKRLGKKRRHWKATAEPAGTCYSSRESHAHLAGAASSPSQCGPAPHPRGPSCHQSSCHLRACKRLQQMWGGGGEGVPKGTLVSTGRRSAASPPQVPLNTRTRPPDSQAPTSQTHPLLGGACSILAPTSFSTPNYHWGAVAYPLPHNSLLQLPPDRAAPSCQRGQSCCKETGG